MRSGMPSKDPLFGISALLLAAVVIAGAAGHDAYLEACVCVANSAGRAAIALGVSLLVGVVRYTWVTNDRISLWIHRFQGIAFLVGVFFVVQHVFFALELA